MKKIANADTIDLVWKSFEKFLDANIRSDQVGVLMLGTEKDMTCVGSIK